MCLHDYKIYDLNYYRLHSEKSESYAFTCVCHSVTEVGEGVVHEGSSHNPPQKKRHYTLVGGTHRTRMHSCSM